MMKLSAIRRKTLSRLGLRRSYALDLPLVAALLVGLALRLLLWDHIPRTGLISDEGEYLSAASWLAHGHSFDWYQGYLWTRAPLYPLFLAAHLRLFGDSLTPIYITQTLLSLINIALVYFLARQLIDQRPTTKDQRDREPQNRGTAEPQNR
jgi:4-amino-4-deoxy-L-arabinose transferase-like glycosyltransferase